MFSHFEKGLSPCYILPCIVHKKTTATRIKITQEAVIVIRNSVYVQLIRISFHHEISTLDLLTFIVGGVVSLGSIGLSGPSSLPQAVNKDAAVHREIALATLLATGATAEIVFTLAGTKVAVDVVAIGHIEPATIHVVVKAFLTALFVFSTNF